MDKFLRPTRRGNPLLREPVGGYGERGNLSTDAARMTGVPTVAGRAGALQPVQITRGQTFDRTVTNVSQSLLPIDHDRRFLFIQNNDTLGVVYLSYGRDAVLGSGMRLSAGGGGILLDVNVPTAELFAIGSIASNPNITIITA